MCLSRAIIAGGQGLQFRRSPLFGNASGTRSLAHTETKEDTVSYSSVLHVLAVNRAVLSTSTFNTLEIAKYYCIQSEQLAWNTSFMAHTRPK